MNNNANSRRPDAALADMTAMIQHLFEQGLQLIINAAPADHASNPDEVELALDALLAQLKRQAETFFEQCQAQVKSLEIPHEAVLASWSQFNALQEAGAALTPGFAMGAMPRLGLLQNRQQQFEQTAAALAELREAQIAYLGLLRQISDDAIEEFRTALKARDDENVRLRELYDLWLNAGEAAYERALSTEAYAATFGRLANAASDFSHQTQCALDDMLEALHLPTRREMLLTQQRLHELRRQFRNQQTMNVEVQGLREELAAMREELERLRQTGQSPRPARRTTRKRDGAH